MFPGWASAGCPVGSMIMLTMMIVLLWIWRWKPCGCAGSASLITARTTIVVKANHRITVVNIWRDLYGNEFSARCKQQKDLEVLGLREVEECKRAKGDEEDGNVRPVGVSPCHWASLVIIMIIMIIIVIITTIIIITCQQISVRGWSWLLEFVKFVPLSVPVQVTSLLWKTILFIGANLKMEAGCKGRGKKKLGKRLTALGKIRYKSYIIINQSRNQSQKFSHFPDRLIANIFINSIANISIITLVILQQQRSKWQGRPASRSPCRARNTIGQTC